MHGAIRVRLMPLSKKYNDHLRTQLRSNYDPVGINPNTGTEVLLEHVRFCPYRLI
jgi:topoisomerase IA-like protein